MLKRLKKFVIITAVIIGLFELVAFAKVRVTTDTDYTGHDLLNVGNMWVAPGGSLTIDTMTLSSGSIIDTTGAITFGDENLTTTGTITGGTLTDGIAQITGGAGTGFTSLTVDNITIDGATITSDTGAIGFDDENLTTTGTITGTNIDATTTFTFSDDTTTNTAPVRSATFVVAASDSSARSIAQADWVCDGTADDVQIQAAIDALPANGGKVLLLEGTFTLAAQIADGGKNNVTFAGIGWNTVLEVAITGINDSIIEISSQSGWVLKNFKLDCSNQTGIHDGIEIASDDCQVTGCYVTNAQHGGIGSSQTSDRLIIENNYLIDNGDDGIISRGPNTVIKSNIVKGTDNNNGISLCYASRGTIVANNIIIEPNLSGIGIELDIHHIDIIGNYIYHPLTGNGITGYDGDHLYVNIIGNYIYPSDGTKGIYSGAGCGHWNIVGNYIYGGEDGIYLTGAYFSVNNNYLLDNTGNSIVTYAIGTSVIGNHISMEESLKVGYGISMRANDFIVTGNYVEDVTGEKAAILIRECSSGIVTDNFLKGDASVGIWLYDALDTTINDNYVEGFTNGIYERPGTTNNNIIRDNRIKDTTTPINVVGEDTRWTEQYSVHFQDCVALSTNYVHAAITGTGAEQEITTAITNPDVPRNVSITNSANSTGDVTIEGIDAKGNSISEAITIVTAGIAYGDVAFSTVSKIIIPATVAGPDTIEVGISDKLGMTNIVYDTGDVYKVKVNNSDKTGEFDMAADVDTDYDTLDMSSLAAGAITADDDITLWFRSNLNIID